MTIQPWKVLYIGTKKEGEIGCIAVQEFARIYAGIIKKDEDGNLYIDGTPASNITEEAFKSVICRIHDDGGYVDCLCTYKGKRTEFRIRIEEAECSQVSSSATL